MDTSTALAIGLVAGVIAISVTISLTLDRLARWRFGRSLRALEGVLDQATAKAGSLPEIRGRIGRRQFTGSRHTELRGITMRSGYNGKAVFQMSCSSALEFTVFTLPQWPFMAELLRLNSPRVSTGDPAIDRSYGFATYDASGFRDWLAKPGSKEALLAVMSWMPSSRPVFTARFRESL